MASASGLSSSPKSPWSRRSAAASDSRKSPERDPQDRWGRAAARALPTMVGTGCRPSVASPRVGGIGSTPMRAAATGASGPRPVGSSAFRRLDHTPCRAAWTRDPGHDLRRLRGRCAMPRTEHNSASHPPPCPSPTDQAFAVAASFAPFRRVLRRCNAAAAAALSASFLLRPVPRASSTPSWETAASNCRSWSGPFDETST